MGYSRIYIRVPLSGSATLINTDQDIRFTVQTINISQGGLALSTIEDELPGGTYHIEIITEENGTISLDAELLRQTDKLLGFQIRKISAESLETILLMVEEYQTTPDFIDQLTQYGMLQQSYIDDDGNELEVTFDTDP